MWKKLLIAVVILVGFLSVAYGYNNNSNINAQVASSKFYGVNEVFFETSTDSFNMGGLNWKIITADQNTGKGYIMAEPFGSYPQTAVEKILADKQKSYSLNNVDEIGRRVRDKNNVSALALMTKEDYIKITKNETDFPFSRAFSGLEDVWTNEFTGSIRIFYYRYPSGYIEFENFTYLLYGTGEPGSNVAPIFEIDLPAKKIYSVEVDNDYVSLKYNQTFNLINLDTISGQGPYQFYIYDTDVNGKGNSSVPSSYFTITNVDKVKGTAEIDQIQKLSAGDYYFKVKVVDECTDEKVYEESSDFSKDESRAKETGVIHVSVTKITPSIVFDNPNMTKKSMHDANTSWSETATATPMNADLDIKYTIVGGDVGMINIDPDTGAITYNGGNAFGKVKIRATVDDDPSTGNDNYNPSFVEKEIVIYREVDGV
ncbi:MAG: hypothetical protein HFF01_05270, partial [Erysipelotrichaceae bacterium]|nr:hypothetical protein [Erysipelotrichaceae bacterium]